MPVLKNRANPARQISGSQAGRRDSADPGLDGHAQDSGLAPGRAELPPWSLAAPSCVLPADVGTNCAALARHFPELGLCFFETGACLAYGEADLPQSLGELPVRWHLHLPLDLPWDLPMGRGPQQVAETILALAEKIAGLAPWAYVLHPPREADQLRELVLLLSERGLRPESLLVENIQGDDLARMWPVVRELGLGVCLDLGHMLKRGQEEFLTLPGLWAHTRMLHLNAPDVARPGRHAALDHLDATGRALLGRMLAAFAPGGSVVLELFSPRELFDSLRFVSGFRADINRHDPGGGKEDIA
jgi:hypothetical protein